jgi:hypothetical protein
MKASDFRTKRYLMGFVVSNGEKVYSDAFRTKRELIEYQSSDFHQWCLSHFKNLSYFVEYHKRRGFVASYFDYISARKYQILALKRSDHFGESYAKPLKITVKHKAYFGEAIAENSLDEMRSIPA